MSGRHIRTVALTVLLACVAGRPLLPQLSYELQTVLTPAGTDGQTSTVHARWPSPSHFLRVALAGALLLAAALSVLADARDGALVIRRPWLVVLIGAFALLSLLSALAAADSRQAWTAWIEQLSLMAACLAVSRLCRRKPARDLVLAALVAACLALVAVSAWQVAVEFPASQSEWQENSDDMLRQTGYAPGSIQARGLEKRMMARTPVGFGGLSNPFASMMIVLAFAAGAMAVERFSAARADRQATSDEKTNDLHLPTLAAVVIAALAASACAVVVLTRSRGAIAAMVLTALAAAGVYRFRHALKRRWRGAMLIVAGVTVLAAAATVGHGLTHDSLPTRTMTFRWYYWTGAARIVGESPVLGTGPGNFANAYLRHRRAQGEEDIKSPHNVVAHALSQYGLPGGLCFVAIVAWVLVASARPGEPEPLPSAEPTDRPALGLKPMILAVAALALAGRWLVHDPAGGAIMLVLHTLLPTAALAGGVVVARWRGGATRRNTPLPPASRILLVCGLVGFVLHNGVTFSMWMPAEALVFWTMAGLCLSQTPAASMWRVRGRRATVVGGALVVAVLLPVLWLALPTANAMLATRTMARRIRAGELAGAMQSARHAAQADPANVTLALDASRLAFHASTVARSPEHAQRLLREAARWAEQAVQRDATDARGHMAAAPALISLGTGQDWRDALDHLDRATALDPMNMRYRIYYASILLQAGRNAQCLDQLDQAQLIDANLPHAGREGGSSIRLSPQEMTHIADMRRRATSGAIKSDTDSN